MRSLQSLPPALKVLIYAVLLGVVFALAMGIGATATIIYERGLSFSGGAGPQQGSNQGDASPQQPTATDYIAEIRDIQNGSVEAFVESNDNFLRPDSLTADDVEDMEANYIALGDYSNQVENLNPPEEYEGQYELFSAAINELYDATEIAYRVAADPISVTLADIEAYDDHVDRATINLEQSNEVLGRDFSTTEGVSRKASS